MLGNVVRTIQGLLASRFGPQVAAALVLALLTGVLHTSGIRYVTVESSIFPPLARGNWAVSERGVSLLRSDPSVIVLRSHPGKRFVYAYRQFGAKFDASHVRLTADIKAEMVRPGEASWQTARVVLWSHGADGKRLRYLPYSVAQAEGTSDWRRHGLVVPLNHATASMSLTLVHAGVEGSMMVRNLTFDLVRQTALFSVLRWGLIALWGVLGFLAIAALMMRFARGFKANLTLATAAVILAAALTPQPHLSNAIASATGAAGSIVGPVAKDLSSLLRSDGESAPPAAEPGETTNAATERTQSTERAQSTEQTQSKDPERKRAQLRDPHSAAPARTEGRSAYRLFPTWAPALGVGPNVHFMAFVLLGFVASLGFPRLPKMHLIGCLLLFALVTEILQMFYVTRTAELGDFITDLAGSLVGVGIGLVVARFARRNGARMALSPLGNQLGQ